MSDMPEMATPKVEVALHSGLSELSAQEWDLLACPEAANGRPIDPFTTHRFFNALETSGSIGGKTGWQLHPLSKKTILRCH